MPPWSRISCGPGVVPSIGCRVTMSTIAIAMKTTSVATLMSANQNSISPNRRTESRLRVSTITRAPRASTHCGTGANNDQ